MSEHAMEPFDDVLPEEPNGEVVHWMAPRPLAVGPAGISIATAAAFAAGVAAAVGVLALMHWLQPPGRGLADRVRRRLRV
jgi:hypothetical protein